MQGVCYRPLRRRTRRRGRLALLLLFSALFLVSCVAGSNVLWIRGFLGIDLMDYRAEAVEETLPVDGALSDSLCATVDLLAVNSTRLEPVSKSSSLIHFYRDELLNHLLRERYSRYTGDADAMEAVQRDYPNMTVSVLIPAADLENLAQSYFGVQNIRHGDGELFTYLEKSGYYTFSMKAWEDSVTVIPEAIEETHHTYRLHFHLQKGEEISRGYVAIFVKRDDGSAYLRALSYDQ